MNCATTPASTHSVQAIAELFAAEGAAITVAEIEEASGREVAAGIRANGGRALAHVTDVSDPNLARAAVAATKAEFGHVDILVNNAAAFAFGRVEDVTHADWDHVFAVNVIGYANMVRECLPELRAARGGAIVSIASVSSYIA